MSGHNRYRTIAVVREIESPENPGGLEKRVAVVPSDIPTLLKPAHRYSLKKVQDWALGFQTKSI